MILKYLQINLHRMINLAIFMTKKYIFWQQTVEKVSTISSVLQETLKNQHSQWR